MPENDRRSYPQRANVVEDNTQKKKSWRPFLKFEIVVSSLRPTGLFGRGVEVIGVVSSSSNPTTTNSFSTIILLNLI